MSLLTRFLKSMDKIKDVIMNVISQISVITEGNTQRILHNGELTCLIEKINDGWRWTNFRGLRGGMRLQNPPINSTGIANSENLAYHELGYYKKKPKKKGI